MVKAAAMARALLPLKLSSDDITLMRKALEMTGREFAETMDITPETLSRWERDAQGVGGYGEKLLRHNVCTLLGGSVPASSRST